MINVHLLPPELGYITTTDTYGGKTITINFNQELVELLHWAREYRSKIEQEIMLRTVNPAASEAFENYQTVLKLVQ
jgi:hypothetical protein